MQFAGPDSFGYLLQDSHEPYGPAFQWIEPGTNAQTIPQSVFSPNRNDGFTGPISIGFSFPLYGSLYSQCYIGTNGYLTFDAGSSSPFNSNFPDGNFGSCILFQSNDLQLVENSTVIHCENLENPARFVLTIDSIGDTSTLNRTTFSTQLILTPDGSIIIQYRDLSGTLPITTIGMQNFDGSHSIAIRDVSVAEHYVVKISQPCYLSTTPVPESGSTLVSTTPVLRWSNGSCTQTCAVYFSTDSSLVAGLDPSVCVVSALTDTFWTVPTELITNTSYYWRIVSRDDIGNSIANPVWSFQTVSDGINGTRTIGGVNGDYPSLHAAITALNREGTRTGVEFLIRGGTYTEPPDSFASGIHASETAPVVFRPADSTLVVINKQCTTAEPYGFKFSGVHHIRFDGSRIEAPGRRFMQVNAQSAQATSSFLIANGCSEITLANLIISAAGASSAGVKATYTTSSPLHQVSDRCTIQHCSIRNVATGIDINCTSAGPGIEPDRWVIADNEIVNFENTGINIRSGTNFTIHHNQIYRITAANTGLTGISYTSYLPSTTMIDANWIYGFQGSQSGSYYGIYSFNGVGKTISNNMICLDSPGGGNVYGIYLGIDRTNVWYNTVRIGGSTTLASAVSAALYISGSSSDSIANNILVNERTGGAAAQYHTAMSCYSFAPTTYCNYNLLTSVDTSASDNRFAVRYNSVNYNTLSDLHRSTAYRWDANSYSTPPHFAGVSDLHIDPSLPTVVEGAALSIESITTDFDGDLRNRFHPDLGADEGIFTSVADHTPPHILFQPLTTWYVSQPRSFQAVIYDNVGVAGGNASPRVFYRILPQLVWESLLSDSVQSDSLFYFTFPAFPMRFLVEYYLAAQDSSGNSITLPEGGSGFNPPGTQPPANRYSFYVSSQLSGSYTIGGSTPDFNTISDAITALNAIAVADGGVIFLLRNGVYSEPEMTIAARLSENRRAIFRVDSGATVQIVNTHLGSDSAAITLRSEFVEFDGSWFPNDSNRHILLEAPQAISGIWFADRASHNTIRNLRINLTQQSDNSAACIRFGNPTGGSSLALSDNRIEQCELHGGNYGIYHCGTALQPINETTIRNCEIVDFGSFGIALSYGTNLDVSRNRIYQTGVSFGFTQTGISLLNDINHSTFDRNYIGQFYSSGNASVVGIRCAGSMNRFANNMIDLGSNSVGTISGLLETSASGGNRFLFNSVRLQGTALNSSSYAFRGNANLGTDTLWGNILVNNRRGNSGPNSVHVALGISNPNRSIFSDYNLLSVLNDDIFDNCYLGFLGDLSYNSLSDLISSPRWIPRDQLSRSEPVPFLSSTDLHLDSTISTAVEQGAPSHPQVSIDFDGSARSTPNCDIGADEGIFRGVSFGIVRGLVVDTTSASAPVTGALITIDRQTDTTDESGHYELRVRSGNHTILFMKSCYRTDSIRIAVDSGQICNVNFWASRPTISLNTSSLELASSPGETRSTSVTIFNTGNAELYWRGKATTGTDLLRNSDSHRSGNAVVRTIADELTTLIQQTAPKKSRFENASRTALPKPRSSSIDELNRVWGPDGYGYIAMDNTSPEWPNFLRFRDISNFGINSVNGFDNGTVLPIYDFSFRYYGQRVQRLWVSTNGFIQFVTNGSTSRTPVALPNILITNGVFVLHSVLNTAVYNHYDAGENIYYVQWRGVLAAVRSDSVDFQVQLHGDNNAIVFVYRHVDIDHLSATIGIQGELGEFDRVLQCYYSVNTSFPLMLDQYAISFNDTTHTGGGWDSWLSINPPEGIIHPLESATFLVSTKIDQAVVPPINLVGSIELRSNACPDLLTLPVMVSVTTEAVETNPALPTEYALHQNFPNPFNPMTEIRFDLPVAGFTKLTVFDVLGRTAETLVKTNLPAGYHSIRFDAGKLSSGMYFYRLESGTFTALKKMAVVK